MNDNNDEEKYLPLGSFIRNDLNDWHLITHLYGDPELFSATGLGKLGSYSMRRSEIRELYTPEKTLIEMALEDKKILWCDKNFKRMYATIPPNFVRNEETVRAFSVYYEKAEVIKRLDDSVNWGECDIIGFPYQVSGLIKLKELDVDNYSDVLKEAKDIIDNLEELKCKKIKEVRFFPEDFDVNKRETYYGKESYYILED